MDTEVPLAWRSEAFAEDLSGDSGFELTLPPYPWASHTAWLSMVPLAVAVLGGVVAFMQALD